MGISFSSFKMENRVLVRIGKSYGVTLNRGYVDMLLLLKSRELTQYYIDYYVILVPSRLSDFKRDFTQIAIRSLELLYHAENNGQIRKKIKEAYDSVVELRELISF